MISCWWRGGIIENRAPAFGPGDTGPEPGRLLVSLIYPGLLRFDPRGRVLPDLALSHELGPEGRSYTFHLDMTRRFEDGSPADAPAVARCFRRLLDPEKPSPRRWVLSRLEGAGEFIAGRQDDIPGLSVLDDSTLVLRLAEPFSPFPGLLAMPATRVYPMGDDGAPARRNGLPLCGGPWRLAEWERGDRFLLERREPGEGFRRLLFRVIPQPFTAVAEFEMGRLDLLTVPQAEQELWLKREKGRMLRRDELSVTYLGLNVRRPPLDDVRVRQALNYALDVDALMRTVRGDAARRCLGPVPPALRSADPAERFIYRPERARQLLAEAGWPEGFEMSIWQKENPEVSRLLEAVQAYLAAVGVKVSIVVRDWGAFKDAVNRGSADAFVMDWLADYPDAENFLHPLFHSSNVGGGGNRSGFSDPYVDLLLDELRVLPEGPARRALVDRLNEALYRKAPWVWLWHPVTLQVPAPDLVGYEPPAIFNGQDYLEARRVEPSRP